VHPCALGSASAEGAALCRGSLRNEGTPSSISRGQRRGRNHTHRVQPQTTGHTRTTHATKNECAQCPGALCGGGGRRGYDAEGGGSGGGATAADPPTSRRLGQGWPRPVRTTTATRTSRQWMLLMMMLMMTPTLLPRLPACQRRPGRPRPQGLGRQRQRRRRAFGRTHTAHPRARPAWQTRRDAHSRPMWSCRM
jgi:hypothetical protein